MSPKRHLPSWYTFDAAQIASLLLLLAGIALLVAAAPWNPIIAKTWQSGVMLGFSGNLITGAITAFVVDVIAQRRSALDQFRALLTDIRSGDKGISKRAFEVLRENGWLRDGTLENTNLSYVQLEGVNLEGARLNGANLTGATLESCNLRGCQLRRGVFDAATIKSCDLSAADLTEAHGLLSDWTVSDLHAAIMKDSRFNNARFESVDFSEAVLDGAQLPDGAV